MGSEKRRYEDMNTIWWISWIAWGMIRAALRLRSFEVSSNNRAGITPALEEPRSFSRRCGCLRHLTIEGKCPAGLNHSLPSLGGWSQRGVPRCLPAADVETLIAACDQTDKVGMRDRAILLLLARLGLRAGDVASLRLPDISWPQATFG